ncbi:MAG: hypothetical protein EOO65_01570 [Methanosarcinales archaeon]|nr:MAG: hypothetical protein EOO65_01570 [Methanosarcinales archaeon]
MGHHFVEAKHWRLSCTTRTVERTSPFYRIRYDCVCEAPPLEGSVRCYRKSAESALCIYNGQLALYAPIDQQRGRTGIIGDDADAPRSIPRAASCGYTINVFQFVDTVVGHVLVHVVFGDHSHSWVNVPPELPPQCERLFKEQRGAAAAVQRNAVTELQNCLITELCSGYNELQPAADGEVRHCLWLPDGFLHPRGVDLLTPPLRRLLLVADTMRDESFITTSVCDDTLAFRIYVPLNERVQLVSDASHYNGLRQHLTEDCTFEGCSLPIQSMREREREFQ